MGMDIDLVSRAIAVIIAPTVLITSCSLLINGLLQRFENMSTRLRGMSVERLRLLREARHHLTDARLRQIGVQAPRMLRRLRLLRNALLAAYLAIFVSVISLLVLATAMLAAVPVAAADGGQSLGAQHRASPGTLRGRLVLTPWRVAPCEREPIAGAWGNQEDREDRTSAISRASSKTLWRSRLSPYSQCTTFGAGMAPVVDPQDTGIAVSTLALDERASTPRRGVGTIPGGSGRSRGSARSGVAATPVHAVCPWLSAASQQASQSRGVP